MMQPAPALDVVPLPNRLHRAALFAGASAEKCGAALEMTRTGCFALEHVLRSDDIDLWQDRWAKA